MNRFKKLLIKYVAQPLRVTYWFLARPKTAGSRVIVQCGNEILFIRNSFGSGNWTFPGGGVEKGETEKECAIRELQEETGIEIDDCTFIGTFKTEANYARDTIHCFHAHVDSKDVDIDIVEIEEAMWSHIDDIPQPQGMHVERILGYLKND